MRQGPSGSPSASPCPEPVWLRVICGAAWLPLFYFAFHVARLGAIAKDVRSFQIAYVVAFLGYAGVLWLWLRRPAPSNRSRARWLIPCLLIRVIPLAVEPTDDAHRYLWEGHVQLAGHNPFALAPDSAILESLRDVDWERINHRDYPAIYPPLAQLEFWAAAALHPSVYTLKVLHTIWDALGVVVLASILAAGGVAPARALLYGACPLVLTAFCVEGHVDSLMILLLLLCWRWDQRGHRMAAGIALGGSIAAKLFPVVFLPWFFFRSKRVLCAALVTVAILYLPYCSAGSSLFGSLGRFSSTDSFFSFLGTMLELDFSNPAVRLGLAVSLAVVLTALAVGGARGSARTGDAPATVGEGADVRRRLGLKLVAGRGWRAWMAYVWPRGDRTDGLDFGRYGVAATGLLVLTIPVVHYWYFALPMVFLAVRWHLAWMMAALLIVVYFGAQEAQVATGTWAMPVDAPLWVWRGFVAAWVAQVWLDYRCIRPAPLTENGGANQSPPR